MKTNPDRDLLQFEGFTHQKALLRTRIVPLWSTKMSITVGDTVIPKGFLTDLASIPSPLWSLFSPWEFGVMASIAHDFEYVTEYWGDPKTERRTNWGAMVSVARQRADRLFYKRLRVDAPLSAIVWYLAVRQFGWIVWRHHTTGMVLAERQRYGIPANIA